MTLADLRKIAARRYIGPKIVSDEFQVNFACCADELLDVVDQTILIASSLSCEDFHHAKEDRHRSDEPCPPWDRFRGALSALEEKLEGMK